MPQEKPKDASKDKPKEERREEASRPEDNSQSFGIAEMNRWFDEPLREFENLFRDPMQWPWGAPGGRAPWANLMRPWTASALLPRMAEIRQPLADIEDKGAEFVVTAEMPGIPKENVEVNVTQDSVEIRAKAQTEQEDKEKGYYRKERVFKELYRHLPLPSAVIPEKAEARMESGLLKIRLPKKDPTRGPKKLSVKVE